MDPFGNTSTKSRVVSIHIKSRMVADTFMEIEQVFVEVMFDKKSLIMGGVYIAPSLNVFGDYNLPESIWIDDEHSDTAVLVERRNHT